MSGCWPSSIFSPPGSPQRGFRGCAFINSFGELGGTSARIPDIVRGLKKEFQDWLARVAAGVGAPAALAPQLAILVEGALTTAAISASPEPARQARAAAEILIDATLTPARAAAPDTS